MRRIIPMILGALLIAGCGSKEPHIAEEPEIRPSQIQIDSAEEKKRKAFVAEYLKNMDDYETMEIAFLGTIGETKTLNDVVTRAAEMDGLEIAGNVKDDHYVYTSNGNEIQNVYLLIPASGIDLSIGHLDLATGAIDSVYMESSGSEPVILMEVADVFDPQFQIDIKNNGEITDSIMTGFNVSSSKLRTAYHMGVVDITPYDELPGGEVPFYSQSLFDYTSSLTGKQLKLMYEMILVDHMYAIFGDEQEDLMYAVTLNSQTGEYECLKTEDLMEWTEVSPQ